MKFSTRFLSLYIFLFFSSQSLAIVNIEKVRAGANKTDGYDATISLDISGKSGNSDTFKSGIGSRVQWYDERWTRFVLFNYEYGESSSVRNTNKTFVHFRNIWYQSERLSWEAFTQAETNQFTRLRLRALLGGGVRYMVFDSDIKTSFLGLGIFRVKEEVDFDATTTDSGVDYATRLNTYFTYNHNLSDTAQLSNTIYVQPNLGNRRDYRIFDQFALRFAVSKDLAFKVSLDITHDNEPPQLIDKTDISYNTGLEYVF